MLLYLLGLATPFVAAALWLAISMLFFIVEERAQSKRAER
jgi:cytochrome c biogenesis protein CcdA